MADHTSTTNGAGFTAVPHSPLSLSERVRERGSNIDNCLYTNPLILAFSRREKEFVS
jgi:hypothetical protein